MRALVFRVVLVVLIVFAANFGGFAYAYLARTTAGNPFFGGEGDVSGLWSAYTTYLGDLIQGNVAGVAVYGDNFGRVLLQAFLSVLACC